ncbi:OLC1v1012762C1 [Oldenlandia corymbosa var. corymbosa]|uniref:OLC1v1012762C1 n=1 Tax=Oldenlandia corymbosa var. corymbosa TaxID=529605 RepID=A0AAV1DWV6_OLDCO|nr:OLC1v1012762C1 [Oldenlandia corymbosa var. corymbosa]
MSVISNSTFVYLMSYLNQYKMLKPFNLIPQGMLLLFLTAAVPGLHPHQCGTGRCLGPTGWQMAFLLTAFGFLVVGSSGIRPCNLAFGADQFNPNTESGRRGINSFFNWYYFTYAFAMMVSLTAIVYVQSNVSWSLGLAIPAILMFFSCALFFAGTKLYVKQIPTGSPLTQIAQVIVAAFRKKRVQLPKQPWPLLFNHAPPNSINCRLSHTEQLRFISKAAVVMPEDKINSDGSSANPWRLSSVQQVEEVKCILRLIPIWVSGSIYYVSVVQQQNYAVFQALQADRRLGYTSFHIPAASYIIFAMLSMTIWLPFYDRILVPLLRKVTGKEDGLTILQRMGIGIFISSLALLLSGLVEHKRKTLALTKPTLGVVPGKGAISSLSAMWLIPQLALSGLSEALAPIAENELFYKQFPENMRSIAAAFFFMGLAGSSYLSSFITSGIHRITGWLQEDLNHGRLDNFYYSMAMLEFLNLGCFLVCAKWYKYKRACNDTNLAVEVNQIN